MSGIQMRLENVNNSVRRVIARDGNLNTLGEAHIDHSQAPVARISKWNAIEPELGRGDAPQAIVARVKDILRTDPAYSKCYSVHVPVSDPKHVALWKSQFGVPRSILKPDGTEGDEIDLHSDIYRGSKSKPYTLAFNILRPMQKSIDGAGLNSEHVATIEHGLGRGFGKHNPELVFNHGGDSRHFMFPDGTMSVNHHELDDSDSSTIAHDALAGAGVDSPSPLHDALHATKSLHIAKDGAGIRADLTDKPSPQQFTSLRRLLQHPKAGGFTYHVYTPEGKFQYLGHGLDSLRSLPFEAHIAKEWEKPPSGYIPKAYWKHHIDRDEQGHSAFQKWAHEKGLPDPSLSITDDYPAYREAEFNYTRGGAHG